MKALRAGPLEDPADEDECHPWRPGFEAVAFERFVRMIRAPDRIYLEHVAEQAKAAAKR